MTTNVNTETNKVFLTPSHFAIKEILFILSREINSLIRKTQENPDDRNFESMILSLNYFEYLQKLMIGEVEDPCTAEVYDKGMKMVGDLSAAGYLDLVSFPVWINKKPQHKVVLTNTQKGLLVEDHIQNHEVEELVMINTTEVSSLEDLETEVSMEPVVKKRKTKKV